MTDMGSHLVALALGTNIGNRADHLKKAVEALQAFVTITAKSPVYETPAAYVTDQSPFLNAALVGTTNLAPETLLRSLKEVEEKVGRKPTFRNGPRVLDIDILFFDNSIIDTPNLVIPHPRMAERDFVLRPLSDIAPDWPHPKLGLVVSEMAQATASEQTRLCEILI